MELDVRCPKKGSYDRVAIWFNSVILYPYNIAWWFFNIFIFLFQPSKGSSSKPTVPKGQGACVTLNLLMIDVMAFRLGSKCGTFYSHFWHLSSELSQSKYTIRSALIRRGQKLNTFCRGDLNDFALSSR